MERALEELPIGSPGPLSIDLVNAPRRPGVDRRVDVAERPLIGWDLAVRVHVPLAQKQGQLSLRELRVHQGQRDGVEGQVPGGVPGVLPLVGHRDDVVVVEVCPLAIAPVLPFRRRWRLSGVAIDPAADIEVVPLLRPKHPGQRLAHHAPGVVGELRRDHSGVELLRLLHSLRDQRVEAFPERRLSEFPIHEPQPDHLALPTFLPGPGSRLPPARGRRTRGKRP